MPQPKFYVPHPFQSRGSGVIMDRKTLTSDRFTSMWTGILRAVSNCNKVRPQNLHPAYSITSSARAIMAGGTVSPSALAVLMLMISCSRVGSCTGRSATFSPLRTRST